MLTLLTRKTVCAILLSYTMLAACSSSDKGTTPTPPPVQDSLDTFIKAQNFSGVVLVTKNEQEIFKKTYGFSDKENSKSNTAQTKFRIGSLSKAFTGLAIVTLKQDGLIASYDDPIKTYLPNSQLSDIITIRHLLNMRSGIPDYANLGFGDATQAYTPSELLGLFESKALDFTPGSKFEYSNSNYSALGLLIETLSGETYIDYLQTNIFNPLGLASTEYGKNTISGDGYALGYTTNSQTTKAGFVDMSYPYAAGSLSSNVDDLQDWALSIENKSLISQADYDDILAGTEYGFGWGINLVADSNIYAHTGGINGFSSSLTVIPEDKGTIIILSNVESSAANITAINNEILRREF